MLTTLPLLENTRFPPLRRGKLETLQINVGNRCNQQCQHCHVNAGPRRTEMMERDTVEHIIAIMGAAEVATVDIPGGAPELHPPFRTIVSAARAQHRHVIDRCNLTVLAEPGQEDLGEFLAAQRVEIIASLPCYHEDNVENQRGKSEFAD